MIKIKNKMAILEIKIKLKWNDPYKTKCVFFFYRIDVRIFTKIFQF